MHYVHVLQSVSQPDKFYTGLCADLRSRLDAHNAGQSPHTAKHKPWRLLSYHAFPDRDKAGAFERYLNPARAARSRRATSVNTNTASSFASGTSPAPRFRTGYPRVNFAPMSMSHLVKRRRLPALTRPLYPAYELAAESAPEPAWRDDLRDFFLAYFAGLIAFGTMLA